MQVSGWRFTVVGCYTVRTCNLSDNVPCAQMSDEQRGAETLGVSRTRSCRSDACRAYAAESLLCFASPLPRSRSRRSHPPTASLSHATERSYDASCIVVSVSNTDSPDAAGAPPFHTPNRYTAKAAPFATCPPQRFVIAQDGSCNGVARPSMLGAVLRCAATVTGPPEHRPALPSPPPPARASRAGMYDGSWERNPAAAAAIHVARIASHVPAAVPPPAAAAHVAAVVAAGRRHRRRPSPPPPPLLRRRRRHRRRLRFHRSDTSTPGGRPRVHRLAMRCIVERRFGAVVARPVARARR